jgi:8-oxo-dGTP pyrophosphatase MutT (NUDIX family)
MRVWFILLGFFKLKNPEMDKNKIRQIIREAFEVQLNEYGGENYPLYNDSNSPNTKVFWGKKAAGILAYAMDTKKFLVPLRSEHVYQPLTYGVIGGKLDEGENNIKQAAIREFEEETDYSGTIKLIPLYIFKTEGFEYNNFLGII